MAFDPNYCAHRNDSFMGQFERLSLASSQSMQVETAAAHAPAQSNAMPLAAPCSYLGEDLEPERTCEKTHRVSLRILPYATHNLDLDISTEAMLKRQALRRRRVLARRRYAAAFAKLTLPKQKNSFLRMACENYLTQLAYTKISISKKGFDHPLSKAYLAAAHDAQEKLPYEESDDAIFQKKYVGIKEKLIDSLNEMGRKLGNS